MNKQHITVFGATGRIGSELLNFLSQAHIPTIAITRQLNKAKNTPFIEWIEADMADKESLHKTMAANSSVFLLSGHSWVFRGS